MTNSPSAMPGAFQFHATQRDAGSAPRVSGAKSHLFQPPRTPPASASNSLILTRSTTPIISASTSTSAANIRAGPRKRGRADDERCERPRTIEDWELHAGAGEAAGRGEDWSPASPMPFVNTTYQLAGGMDTPTLAATRLHDRDIGGSEYSDVGYRKSLSGDGVQDPRRDLYEEQEGGNYFALDREANGRGRGYGGQDNRGGWGRAVTQVVGGVVGKVWEFCKYGKAAFSGFQAGGGTGYKVDPTSAQFQPTEIGASYWKSEKCYNERESTPIPGHFPDEGFIPDYMDNPTPEPSPARPAKRRQTSNTYSNDELTKNWVVVPTQFTPAHTPTAVKPQLRAGSAKYSAPTASSASRRSIAAPVRPASRAGLGAPGSRRPQLLSRGSHAGSPALQSNRGASFASPRSPASASKIPRASGSPMREMKTNGKSTGDSPAAKEAQRWAALKRKEDREADESIRRLDKQLKAMIREGKEALGTKIEVEMDDEFDKPGNQKWAF